MDSVPVFKQLIELLNWILVSIDHFLAAQGWGPDWTWGLAIIGLTIIVRLILFPLTWKQFSSAQAMQAIQPRIKELQRKYKKDRNKLQQETMKLYQEHRVNPFASCLPLILQLPVFISLYYAIRGTDYLNAETTQQLADAGFLWIKSVAAGGGGLGNPDPTYVLLVLYVVTQLISTELMLATQSDKTQKMLMRSMPIVFIFILWRFPAGLFIYWVTTNLWTIGQQLLIRKVMKPFDLTTASGQPAKRSRVVDALVSAQDQSGKDRSESGTKKRDSGGQAQDRSSRKQTKAGQKPGGSAAKPAGSGSTKPDSRQGASSNAKKRGGKRAAKRSGSKPPPGKGESKATPAGDTQSARSGGREPPPGESRGTPPEAPEAPDAPDLGTSVSSPPKAPDSETSKNGPVES